MKPKAREIVRVLDLLTVGGPEALPSRQAQPALRLRQLLGKNVVAVGVGEKFRNGKRAGTLALRFYVLRKVPLRRLNAAEAVPPAVDPALNPGGAAIPTDVIVLGKLRLDAAHIEPGDSIGHVKATAGTLGALVRRKGKFALLSNSHVLARSGKAKAGDAILSPAKDDGGGVPKDVVARLLAFKKFVKGGAFVNTADCAIATPVAARLKDCRSVIPGVGVPRGTTTPKRGMKIVIVGRTSGKSTGTIEDVHFRFVFDYEGIGKVGFTDQVLCTRYSAPGDSGSLVVDRTTKRAVGLHFAGAPNGSVFCPIGNVLKALDITLVTTLVN